MIIQIQQVNRYTLSIDGMEYHEYKLESEWEGMAKYVGPEGTIIVSKDNTFENNVFGKIFGNDDGETRLVKASPDIIGEIKTTPKG